MYFIGIERKERNEWRWIYFYVGAQYRGKSGPLYISLFSLYSNKIHPYLCKPVSVTIGYLYTNILFFVTWLAREKREKWMMTFVFYNVLPTPCIFSLFSLLLYHPKLTADIMSLYILSHYLYHQTPIQVFLPYST